MKAAILRWLFPMTTSYKINRFLQSLAAPRDVTGAQGRRGLCLHCPAVRMARLRRRMGLPGHAALTNNERKEERNKEINSVVSREL